MDPKESVKFIQVVSQPLMAASAKVQLNMSTLNRDFGLNYNTLSVINTSGASAVWVYLDGKKAKYIGPGGSWSFDWEYGLKYTLIELENIDTINAIALDTVRVSVGRTGP